VIRFDRDAGWMVDHRTIPPFTSKTSPLARDQFPKIGRETRSILVTPLVREGVPLGATCRRS